MIRFTTRDIHGLVAVAAVALAVRMVLSPDENDATKYASKMIWSAMAFAFGAACYLGRSRWPPVMSSQVGPCFIVGLHPDCALPDVQPCDPWLFRRLPGETGGVSPEIEFDVS